jgi:hypothetical protein
MARDDGFDRGWDGHARRQACLGLELTPTERLEWLDSALRGMREILGAASKGRTDVASPRIADPD